MIMRDEKYEPLGQHAFLDVARSINRSYKIRLLRHAFGAFCRALLCLSLLMPAVASAVSVKEQALKSLKCGEMEWEDCKVVLGAQSPEEQYRLVSMLNWSYRYKRDELTDIKLFLINSAATRGHPRAQYDMAGYYYCARKDLELAAQWYETWRPTPRQTRPCSRMRRIGPSTFAMIHGSGGSRIWCSLSQCYCC